MPLPATTPQPKRVRCRHLQRQYGRKNAGVEIAGTVAISDAKAKGVIDRGLFFGALGGATKSFIASTFCLGCCARWLAS